MILEYMGQDPRTLVRNPGGRAKEPPKKEKTRKRQGISSVIEAAKAAKAAKYFDNLLTKARQVGVDTSYGKPWMTNLWHVAVEQDAIPDWDWEEDNWITYLKGKIARDVLGVSLDAVDAEPAAKEMAIEDWLTMWGYERHKPFVPDFGPEPLPEPQTVAAGKYYVPLPQGDTATVHQMDHDTRLVQRETAAGPLAVEVEEIPAHVPVEQTAVEVATPGERVTGRVTNRATLETQRATAGGYEIEVPTVPDVDAYKEALRRMRQNWLDYVPFVGIGVGLFRIFGG